VYDILKQLDIIKTLHLMGQRKLALMGHWARNKTAGSLDGVDMFGSIL
jgi:hypothetical protein